MMLSKNWGAYGASITNFDDGHIPENLRDSPRKQTKIIEYDLFQKQDAAVQVFHDVFEGSHLLDALYDKTVGSEQWGDYVTIGQIQKFWENKKNEGASSVLKITAKFLELALGEGPVPVKHFSSGKNASQPLFSRANLNAAHGVAVWGLAAPCGSCVPFHLDYAEQLRYEHNIIVPPLLAGTLQCSKDKIEGGNFYVSLKGISHYESIGYKAKRQPVDMDDPDVITLPYKYNQLTCHLGNLPHGSTNVEKIHGDQLRVIVGFNVFCAKSGPLVQLAPEHSEKFRRKILGMKMLSQDVSLQFLKRNKPLARLLVLAKREKVKNEFRRSQERLKRQIPSHLPATVQELADRFCADPTNYSWPHKPEDMQVFIYDQVLKGEYRLAESGEEPIHCRDSVSMAATVELHSTAANDNT